MGFFIILLSLPWGMFEIFYEKEKGKEKSP